MPPQNNSMFTPPSVGIQRKPFGPSITPQSMTGTDQGGEKQPPYLQMRTKPGRNPGAANGWDSGLDANPYSPTATTIGQPPSGDRPTMPSRPMISPPSSFTPPPQVPTQPKLPNEVGATNIPSMGLPPSGTKPAISPPPGASPPQVGGNSLGDLYKFFAADLANQTKQAKSSAIADASSRGVYYGTPLTGSEADIDTQYLRGLGQLQSGMYGNEQSNQLARLGLATNMYGMDQSNQLGRLGLATSLLGQSKDNAPPTPQGVDWSGIGQLFGTGSNKPAMAQERSGPVITPQKKNVSGKNNPAGKEQTD